MRAHYASVLAGPGGSTDPTSVSNLDHPAQLVRLIAGYLASRDHRFKGLLTLERTLKTVVKSIDQRSAEAGFWECTSWVGEYPTDWAQLDTSLNHAALLRGWRAATVSKHRDLNGGDFE